MGPAVCRAFVVSSGYPIPLKQLTTKINIKIVPFPGKENTCGTRTVLFIFYRGLEGECVFKAMTKI